MTDADELRARLAAWLRRHRTAHGFIPTRIALSLGPLDAWNALVDDGICVRERHGYTLR